MRTALATLVAAVVLVATPASADPNSTIHPKPHWLVTPCAFEDGINCYWNARARGNHEGRSYFSIRLPHRTCMLYFNGHGDHCTLDSNASGDGDKAAWR